MAELAPPVLRWPDDAGLDPGERKVLLPEPPPQIGDDFHWEQRDFESFRLVMWTELQERFPERKRWNAGDVEAVLVEALASQLDQLSDMADRVSAESYLLTARRVPSLLAWLSFIGYEPWRESNMSLEKLLQLYCDEPHEMELDRRRGPASIRRQKRMACTGDYRTELERHPLVERAYMNRAWNGSWMDLVATVALWKDWRLDDQLDDRLGKDNDPLPDGTRERALVQRQKDAIADHHERLGIRPPQWQQKPTIRELLGDTVRRFRMTGQTVLLADVIPVALEIELCVTMDERYFQSEIRREVDRVMGRGPDGFFRPGRLAAGQDIRLSDIYERVIGLDGVIDLSLIRFGKARDKPAVGIVPEKIEMDPDELAVCARRGPGVLEVKLRGGRRG